MRWIVTGKTSLLVEICSQLKLQRGLYLAYNKSVATKSKTKFPKTINCSTTHAFAYQNTIKNYGLTIGQFFWKSIEEFMSYPEKVQLLEVMKEWTSSGFDTFDKYRTSKTREDNISNEIFDLTKQYFNRMIQGKIPITHDGYLKFYHMLLAHDKIKHNQYDLIAIDEAGDVSAVTYEIFKLLPAKQKILVGDNCIPGYTRVETSSGWRRMASIVKSIEDGKEVFVNSYSENTKKFEYKKVLNSIRSGEKEVFKIKTSNSTFSCTDNHKILTPNGYTQLKNLKIGDHVSRNINRQDYKTPRMASDIQYQLLLGSFLGDGHISVPTLYTNNIIRLQVSHCESQLEWLKYKANAFNSKIKLSTEAKKITIKGKECNIQNQYSFVSKGLGLNKPITLKSITSMKPLALATWVMDDGSLRNKYHKEDKQLSITIDSNSFSLKENEFLVKVLFDNFGLKADIQKTRTYYRLSFKKEESLKLKKIILPYVTNNFIGKFKHEESKVMDISTSLDGYSVDVITEIKKTKICKVFDIEVEDNHNFIISDTAQLKGSSGVIVHNCQNIYSFNKTINCFPLAQQDGALMLSMSQSFRCADSIANRIDAFMKLYIPGSIDFKGVKYDSYEIKTSAYISRNNAVLIEKMIEFNLSGTKYNLLRKVDAIFELILILLSANNQEKKITQGEYKYLQEDIDDWNQNQQLQMDFATPYKYLIELYAEEPGFKTGFSLISSHGPKVIYETYQNAKEHEGEKTNHPISLGTAFGTKGSEFDKVTILSDLNGSLDKIFDKKGYDPLNYDENDKTEFLLYYVAVSRCKYELINAIHLPTI